ncbi:MAG: STAS domain-containing protein [Mycobacterium sp.]
MSTLLALDTARSDDGQLVLTAVGEIDLSNIDAFTQALGAAIAENAGGHETLIVDLSAVDYLDSAAINALFAHAERLHVIARPLLTRIFTISGLAELATIETAPV